MAVTASRMTDGAHDRIAGDLAARGRALLREMTVLAAGRARAEADTADTYASAGSEARVRHDEQQDALRTRHAEEMRAETTAYRQRLEAIKTNANDDHGHTAHAQTDEREHILGKARANEKEARKQLEEAIWLAETVYEAAEDQPEEEFRQKEQVIEVRRSELLQVSEQGRTLLRKYRQKAPAIRAGDETVEPVSDEAAADAAAALEARTETARTKLTELSRLRLPRLFRGFQLHLLVLLALGGAGVLTAWRHQWQVDMWVAINAGATALVLGALIAILYALAKKQVRAVHGPLAEAVHGGLDAASACLRRAEAERGERENELLERRNGDIAEAKRTYEPIIDQIRQRRDRHLARIEEKYPPKLDAIIRRRAEDLASLEKEHETTTTGIQRRYEEGQAETTAELQRVMAEREARHEQEWRSLESTWTEGMERGRAELAAIRAENETLFPPWDDPAWKDWVPPTLFAPSIRFGEVAVDLDAVPGGLPSDERLQVDVPPTFALPATLDFPERCSLLLRSGAEGREAAVGTLQTVMFRLLTDLPPGKVRFTIIDPVRLGQNFAGFMHLVDYDESFVASRIWTEQRHIEQRLGDLSEHMETVIQKYLRNEFETIAEYNEQAGEIAEPYRFLVISDFPVNFSETAAKRLASIVGSGARCGVHTLISVDDRQALPPGLDLADVEARSVTLIHKDGRYAWRDDVLGHLPLTLDAPPGEEFLNEKLHLIGEASGDATRVEVPFDVVAPTPEKTWSRECTRTLTVPLGRCGATKLQELIIGAGTSQHVLIAGKTGSGKSTLLHVLITNLALWYSPDEVQFYLVDFKKGVEFKTYATHNLAHARAVAVESDREFGLSVLQRIDAELKHRGELFRELGVQDLAGYRRQQPDTPLPRILLVIDEFQEMFVEDDKIGQDAALLMDRLVRQGRAFGVHVLLGSQTLGGAYTLARSTMGQMQVRIALQCSEADSYLIMSDDNAAARLLSRPGEAIYNDAGGAIEGNSPFQIVWLSDRERDTQLERAATLARDNGYERAEPMIVFEGNVPADVRANHRLEALLAGDAWAEAPGAPRGWLGEAIAIKDATNAYFRRQSGSNLLMVGQQEESALAMTATALVSLAAHGPDTIVYLLDGSPADSLRAGYLGTVAEALPHDVRNVKWRAVPEAMTEIAAELQQRQEDDHTDAPPIFVVIYGLQRFRMLRTSDDFGFSSLDEDKPPAPDRQFGDILRDGAPYGIHTLAWCDTATNLNRTLDRNGLRDFEMRVLFQMSGVDSTQLIDSPLASKLGLRRALYHNEEDGVLEKFRPYALPDDEWLATVREALGGKLAAPSPE